MDGHGAQEDLDELRRWCSSGLLWLTGHPAEPAAPPRGLVGALDALTRRLSLVAEDPGRPVALSWEELILGRAALRSFTRQGRRSANGSCRLLAAEDGWVALNLARDDDHELLEALIEAPLERDEDARVARWAQQLGAEQVVERGRLLGLAVARLAAPGATSPAVREPIAPTQARDPARPLVVVDLSSMWAGPLCAHLLEQFGARVIKVESETRPDGARQDPSFYSWLHRHEQLATLDFASADGRGELRALLESADVVLESSRPRALAQLGLDPHELTLKPGMVWLSITGHGRAEGAAAIAFGDDAAVAGGLVAFDRAGQPVFCADAIADPVTGMVGALEVLTSIGAGGGVLLDLAMARAASSLLDPTRWGEASALGLASGHQGEGILVDGEVLELRPPALPAVAA